MKVEEGIFIRTKEGYICKILKLNEPFEDDGYLDHNDIGSASIQEKNVVKASYKIINLIEVGDYVNGSKLLSIDYAEDKFGNCDKLHYYYSFEDVDKDVNEYYEKLVIKSIVTKEQFSQMEYKID